MITYRYINRNIQPASVSFTLLIEDEDKDEFQDTIRIEKVFKVDTREIDDEFLRAAAKIEIERIRYELENPRVIPPLEEIPSVEETPVEETPSGDFSE